MTILACTDYDGLVGYLAEGPDLVAVDPDHMKVTFTAPATGKVLVRLTGFVETYSGNVMKFGLIDADSGHHVVPARVVAGGSVPFAGLASVALPVRNLAPGQTYTYLWGVAAIVEASLNVAEGDGWPPAVIEIHALP